MAAENAVWLPNCKNFVMSFNEAAAHGRGKRHFFGPGGGAGAASMRPRRMAAENVARHLAVAERTVRFNEAAAHGRGKLMVNQAIGNLGNGFNEAAAHGRGKRRGRNRRDDGYQASMRPRRMAAENAEEAWTLVSSGALLQ